MVSRLILEPPQLTGDLVEAAARLEFPGGMHRIWFRFPAQWRHALTPWADPFVVAFLFPMVQRGGDFLVEGRVSPSLLENLERHCALWRAWRPDLYRPIIIRAAEEAESPPAPPGTAAIAFSGGIDSCFTAWRHAREPALMGRRRRKPAAGIVINGMDITLDDPLGPSRFAAALSGARHMLQSIDLACIPVSSNFREIPSYSGHSHITLLVASLMLFAGAFDAGLIPNTVGHSQLETIWGSHPLLDPLLGSLHFPIFDDGVEHTRSQKIPLLARWPQAMQHLRVCFAGADGGIGNCCRCEKCIRTLLAFRIAGIPRPPVFPHDITDRQIRAVTYHGEIILNYWKELITDAAAQNLSHTSWAKALPIPIRRHRQRQRWNRLTQPLIPLRNLTRKLFRGSPLSRRQRAEAQ